MSKVEKIQNEILSLSIEERELIGIFVKKQNAMEAGYHEAWETELQKRLEEVKNGTANLVSAKSALDDIRKQVLK